MIKFSFLIFTLIIFTGCTIKLPNSSDEEQKEYILTQLNDHQGLIKIYRERLRKKDIPEDRFYLSNLYNKVGEYSSSNIYLEPLLKNSKDQRFLLLYVKNLLELGKEKDCEQILDMLIRENATNGELFNLQGITFAQQGEYDKAIISFEKARSLFYDEEIVINNMSMMEILNGDFLKARDYLLELYSRKKFKSQTVYNLVYTLVKTNDDESARKVIIDEKLSVVDPYKLIDDLKQISPKKHSKKNNRVIAENINEENVGKVVLPQFTDTSGMNFNGQSLTSQHTSAESTQQTLCIPQINWNDAPRPFDGTIKGAKKIIDVTNSNESDRTIVTLHSFFPLNYTILPQDINNQLRILLFNTMPDVNLFKRQLALIGKSNDITNLEFVNHEGDSSILILSTKRCIASKEVVRSVKNKTNKESLIIKLYH